MFYSDFSFDQDIIECLTNDKLKRKIDIPDRYDITNIEIGFGNGEFLIKNAISRPNELFIGVEVYLNGIAKVLESILDFGLKNIMLSNLNSSYFLEAMPDKSIDKIFPEAWEEFHSVAGEIMFLPWLFIFLLVVTAIETRRLKKIESNQMSQK